MYTAVLMAALTTTTASPNFGRNYGYSYSTYYGSTCCSPYPYSYNPGCYGYGYGVSGYGYGYPYGGMYDPGYGGRSGCYGCYGGHSCYGIAVPAASVGPRPGANPPVRDPYLPINPRSKMDVTPEKDGAEEVAAPKEKKPDIKKAPEPAKTPDEPKKTFRIDPTAPIRAKVRIEVPEGGKLFVDDRLINVPAGTRVFQTPPLAPGERYFYDIRIERAGEVRSRRVVIEPGQDVAVSFPALASSAQVNR